MERNFLGLNQSQENLLLLMIEGNNPQEIAEILKTPLTSVYYWCKLIRDILEAKTNEQAVALFLMDLYKHGYKVEKKATATVVQ